MDKLKAELLALGVKNLILKEAGKVVWQFQTEPNRLFNQYSVTKAFTALACLAACRAGFLSLDSNVTELLKKLEAANKANLSSTNTEQIETHIKANCVENLAITAKEVRYDVSELNALAIKLEQAELQLLFCNLPKRARLEQLTIRHLLNMTSGHGQTHMFIDERQKLSLGTNWFDFCLNLSFARRPGTHFLYTNAGPYMAGVLVQALTGKRLSQNLANLFKLGLGMEHVKWQQDPLGYEFGASELFMSTEKLSEFAEILRKGGQAYTSEEALKLATSVSYNNAEKGIYYGYGFWLYPDGAYRADGSHGQYIMVDAKRNLSLAVNSDATDERQLKELLYTSLIKH